MLSSLPSLALGSLRLSAAEGGLAVDGAGASAWLPPAALLSLFARYGRPLDDGVAPPEAWLDLGGGLRLGALSHKSAVDVIANDFALLDEGTGAAPRAVPMPLLVAALSALARAASNAAR